MGSMEDAGTILENFINDAANLPAEMTHIMEEIREKDREMQESRSIINQHDSTLQRHVKQNGGHAKHPKEDKMREEVETHYEKAMKLQEEKLALCDKARSLLDRHVRRLDSKIRDLQNEGSLPLDSSLPSMFREESLLAPLASGSGTGTNTPLASFLNTNNNHGGGAANIANAAMARMAHSGAFDERGFPPSAAIAGMQPHPMLNGAGAARSQRETSLGASSETKKRRLNATLGTLPERPSNLARQSSLGPGTPKATTPGSRAGSAGPRTKKMTKKSTSQEESMRKKVVKAGIKKARRAHGTKASPSTTGEDGSEASASDEDRASHTAGHDGAADEEEVENAADYDEEDEVEDNRLYCTCYSVSHGEMIACDNMQCEREWFHYKCVGLDKEPKGKWLCPNCRQLPQSQLKITRGRT